MVGMYPLGPVVEGAGLNITVMSYCGIVYFGLSGCRETVPDLAELPEMITESLDELLELVRAEKMARAGTSAGPPDGAGAGTAAWAGELLAGRPRGAGRAESRGSHGRTRLSRSGAPCRSPGAWARAGRSGNVRKVSKLVPPLTIATSHNLESEGGKFRNENQ